MAGKLKRYPVVRASMHLHNFNFTCHVLVDMADKPNFRMFRDSFDIRHHVLISIFYEMVVLFHFPLFILDAINFDSFIPLRNLTHTSRP